MEASFDQGPKKREKPLVLLCVRSNILKTSGFIVFSLKHLKKTIGFIMFSLRSDDKQFVLLCFRSKKLKNHWFYCVFGPKY